MTRHDIVIELWQLVWLCEGCPFSWKCTPLYSDCHIQDYLLCSTTAHIPFLLAPYLCLPKHQTGLLRISVFRHVYCLQHLPRTRSQQRIADWVE